MLWESSVPVCGISSARGVNCAIIHRPAPCSLRMYCLWLAGGRSERGCGCFLEDHMDLDQTVGGHWCLQLAGRCLQLALKSKTGEWAVAGTIKYKAVFQRNTTL